MAKSTFVTKKIFYSQDEASKVLGVRPHFFANNFRTLGLEKIHQSPLGFSEAEIEFWKNVIHFKNRGMANDHIINEIEFNKKRKAKSLKFIDKLNELKSILNEVRSAAEEDLKSQ